jgi:hypothetical protein
MYRTCGLVFIVVLAAIACEPRDAAIQHQLEVGDRVLMTVEIEPSSEVIGGSVTVRNSAGLELYFVVFNFPKSLNLERAFANELYLRSGPVTDEMIDFLDDASEREFNASGSVYFNSGGLVRDNINNVRSTISRWKAESNGALIRKIADLPGFRVEDQ